MNKAVRTVLMLFGASALTGCVSQYSPQAGRETVPLTLVRGASQLGGKSLQVYEGYGDNKCTPAPGTGRLAALLSYGSGSETVQVASGQQIFILAETSLYGAQPSIQAPKTMQLTRDGCVNVVSFTPLSGHKYELKQDGSQTRCSITVIDKTTAATPKDLQQHDPKLCPPSQY